MKYFLIFSCLIFSTTLFSQKISGIVVDEDDHLLPAVMVFNMKTEQKTYTNQNGEFTIEASENTELRFIRNGFERASKTINSKDFSTFFQIKLFRLVEEIEEVQVPNYRLSGDINKDSEKLSKVDKVEQLKKEIGVPGPPEKPREVPPPTVKEAGVIGFALSNLNLNTLYRNISGDGKRMRRLYKYEDLQDNVNWIRSRIPDEYFTKMGIPQEKISEFLQFSFGQKPDMAKYIKARNLSRIMLDLEETFPLYLKK